MEVYTISLPDVTPLKLVTAKATYGIGFLTYFIGGFCTLFGIPNNMYTEKIKKAEALAMKELKTNAKLIGADGVMDVRCQIDGLSFLITGTAYKWTAEERAKRKNEERVRLEMEERAKREAEQLSISDIESTASAFLKHRVSISDINCTLIYVIPKSTGKPKEMHLDMSVGDAEFTSLDLFFDQRRKAYFFKGRQLALDGAWRSAEEVFGFDVSLFKEFNTEVDDDE